MSRAPSKSQHEIQVYEYTLNLISVKMKVKFPCKMKIQHNSIALTSEIQSKDSHVFVFNEEITVRESIEKQHFDLTVNLLTEKGAKYIAGSIKLYHNELIRSEGERVVVALGKCLDNQSVCEIKVQRVSVSKIHARKPHNQRAVVVNFGDLPEFQQPERVSPKGHFGTNSAYVSKHDRGIVQTKSEFQFPVNNQRDRHEWDNKSREMPLSFYQRNASRSPVNTRSNFNRSKINKSNNRNVRERIHTDLNEDGQMDISRDKMIEAEVYKEGYAKLKEKFKKEAENAKNELNKRIALQNIENNLRLEIMRYKLKSEEQEKYLNDKNQKIRELQTQVSSLQEKQATITYLKESLEAKEQAISSLQGTIQDLSHQNSELNVLISNKHTEQFEKIQRLSKELEELRNSSSQKKKQFEKDLTEKSNQLNQKQNELILKAQQLEREKKQTQDLQKAVQSKTYECERAIQHEKTLAQNKVSDLTSKIDKLDRQLSYLQGEHREAQKALESSKSLQMKTSYDLRIAEQEGESLKNDNQELKQFKEKYLQLFREQRFINEEKINLEKQLEKIIQSKDFNLGEMARQNHDQVEYYKRINRELEDRVKNSNNKIIELQGQMDIVKNQTEKVRRNNQNLVKDLAEAKEKQKQAKKTQKQKEQELLSLEAEYSTIRQKSKNIDQIHKLEEDKLKDEIQKLKSELEGEYIRSSQLGENNTELAMEISRLKIKLQYTEERLEKDSSNLQDRQHQLENLIKDYEQQIDSLESNLNESRQSQKELLSKSQRIEVDLIKSEELADKRLKQIKVLEEKYQSVENICRAKQNDLNNLQFDRSELEKLFEQSKDENSQLKSQNISLKSSQNKQEKLTQMQEEEIRKLKADLQKKKDGISQRERSLEETRQEVKSLREDLNKSEFKFISLKKEADRFRQSLIEGLNGSFIPILNTFTSHSEESSQRNSQRLILGSQSELNLQPRSNLIVSSTAQTQASTNTEILSMVISHSKDIKLVLSRLCEQNRQLVKETERLNQEASSHLSKHQTSEFQLHRTIQELEEQISRILNEKEEDNIRNDHEIAKKDNEIKEQENIIGDLNQQLEEVQFTLNSLKMDLEAVSQEHNKKSLHYKTQLTELEEKIEEIVAQNTELEDTIYRLESDTEAKERELEQEIESHLKAKLKIQELTDQSYNSEEALAALKHSKKELLERISELQLLLNTQTEHKNKLQQFLTEEENKCNELKIFVANLMKQKETAIKSEIQKSEQLMALQTINIELQRDKEMLQDQSARVKSGYEEQKQELKKCISELKEVQGSYQNELSLKSRISEKLKDREKQIAGLNESLRKLQAKFDKEQERARNQIQQLQQEIDEKNFEAGEQSKDSSEQFLNYERRIHDSSNKILQLENRVIELEEQAYQLNESVQHHKEETASKEKELSEVYQQLQMQRQQAESLTEELKVKEENMFQISGKIYTLENQIQSIQAEMEGKLSNLDSEWIEKYENVCDEYEQRLELVEKQREYFKGIIEERVEELRKLKQDIKSSEIEDSQVRRSLEDKIKKLEEDRLSLFTLKNNEIHRLTEETKNQFQQMKSKESEHRRVTNELEIARASITSLDQKLKETEEKSRNLSRVYTAELEQLKKKENGHKNYKEWVANQQWTMERQVRKVIQGFVKRFIENSEERGSTKIFEIVKSLQGLVVEVISNNRLASGDADPR